MIFLLAVVCLVSVPAFSGENPWDADGGGQNGTGSPFDSLANDVGTKLSTAAVPQTPTVEQRTGWFSRVTLRASYLLIEMFSGKSIKKAQISGPAY